MPSGKSDVDFRAVDETLDGRVICPWCGKEMRWALVDADCAGGSHREIEGWYCSACDYSTDGEKACTLSQVRPMKEFPSTLEEFMLVLFGG